jgi:rubredoxin
MYDCKTRPRSSTTPFFHCGYIYDEALGVPEEGIPTGTRWEDVPDLWTCLDCAMGKADFKLVATV